MRWLLSFAFSLLLCAASFGQTGDFAPTQTASNPLQLRIADGKVGGGILGTYQLIATNVLLTASSTNFIYLDLSQSPPVLTVNTTGFPTSQVYKIATAVTSVSQITSLADNRPALNLNLPGAAGNGVGSGAAPIMAFYLCSISNPVSCPTTSSSGQVFASPINTQQFNDCNFTSGSAIITCASNHFVAGDVGKRAFGYDSCQAFANMTAGHAIATSAILTIATVDSPTQVHLSGNSLQSGSPATNTHCFIYGNPDDAGAAAMDTAAQAAGTCPKLMFAGGYYLFTVPHFFTQPAACKLLPSLNNGAFAIFGNMFYSAGYELEGRGTGPTTWFITPGFPESGGCTNGLSGKACFAVTMEGRWRDLMISGGGNFSAPNFTTSHEILIEVPGPASLDNFSVTNFGGLTTNTVCVGAFGLAQLYQVNLSGCAGVLLGTSTSTNITAIKMSLDNPSLWALGLNALTDYSSYNPAILGEYNFVCYDCQFYSGVNGGSVTMIANTSQSLKLYHSNLNTQLDTHGGDLGYQCIAAGCLLDAEDSDFDMTGGGTNATSIAAVSCTAACTNRFQGSTIKGAGGANSYSDGSASSILYDRGNNIFGTTNSITGSIIGEANSSAQTIVTAAKLVLSAGWGSTAANTALSGGDAPIQFTITNSGTGQLASPTITYTFPTPYLISPYSCTATQIGGTNATGTFTSSALSKTGVTFTFSLTPTASSTEIVNVTCVTP